MYVVLCTNTLKVIAEDVEERATRGMFDILLYHMHDQPRYLVVGSFYLLILFASPDYPVSNFTNYSTAGH